MNTHDVDATRFEQSFHIEPNTGCWLWLGAIQVEGYGTFTARSDRRKHLAHRYGYELLRGPIPVGLQLDHLCRQRCCVNPDHLEPVTTQENTRRGDAGRMRREWTHCPAGHPFSGDNLVLNGNRRRCRACRRARMSAENRRQYLRRKAARAGGAR